MEKASGERFEDKENYYLKDKKEKFI